MTATPKTLTEILKQAGIYFERTATDASHWFDAYGEMICTTDGGWPAVERFLKDRADADCDEIGFIPNREMSILTEVEFARRF